jgi:hypothetical protein
MCEGEERDGEGETVESLSEGRRGGEIGVVPEFVKQRVVEPVVVTEVV